MPSLFSFIPWKEESTNGFTKFHSHLQNKKIMFIDTILEYCQKYVFCFIYLLNFFVIILSFFAFSNNKSVLWCHCFKMICVLQFLKTTVTHKKNCILSGHIGDWFKNNWNIGLCCSNQIKFTWLLIFWIRQPSILEKKKTTDNCMWQLFSFVVHFKQAMTQISYGIFEHEIEN